MHCNGKCYLAKQLNKEEKKDKGIQKVNKEVTELMLIVPEYQFFQITLFKEKMEFNSFYLTKNYDSSLELFFRPPIV